MGPHRRPVDRQVVAVEDELVRVGALRPQRQAFDERAGGSGRHRGDPPRRQRCRRASPQLGGDGRPGRVGVGPPELRALEARPTTRHDERPEADASVAHHHRQVRHAPAGPGGAQRRVDDVVGDHDGEPWVVPRQVDRAAPGRGRPDDGDALAAQEPCDRVGEGTPPVHLDPLERLGEHVDHRR
ncbi:hypothetical protein BIU97_12400 [Curtobacterium sp. MCBA15_009]|nr:hypothetical protein BIU92_03670 [Curtobacterium sp. MCBA15_003]OII09329.1 hypothetical protein BIU97_12400 [Curtobacterium sp. MCBA15_009]